MITISALSHHRGGRVAIIAPSSSTIIPYGRQRNLGIESKNVHCTYQTLHASLFAFSAATCRKQLFLVLSPCHPAADPICRKNTCPERLHTSCGGSGLSRGPQALSGALTHLLGSETPRNLGLSDSVLLERKKEEAKPQSGWLCGSRHSHPTSGLTWQR